MCVRFLGLCLATLSIQLTIAQTTQPTTQPNGLAMSPEQIRARLEKLNRAATQPVTDPSKLADRDRLIENHKATIAREESSRDRWVTLYGQYQAKAREVAAALAEVQQLGRQAESNFWNLVNQYNVAAAAAKDAGHSSFTATGRTYTQDGIETTDIVGSSYDPAAELAAVMAVESRYGPDLKQAREDLQTLLNQQATLMQQYKQLIGVLNQAPREIQKSNARIAFASQELNRLQLAQSQQQTSTESQVADFWTEVEKLYPGADVRTMWNASLKEASEIIGTDNLEKLNLLATKFCEDKLKAAGFEIKPWPPRD